MWLMLRLGGVEPLLVITCVSSSSVMPFPSFSPSWSPLGRVFCATVFPRQIMGFNFPFKEHQTVHVASVPLQEMASSEAWPARLFVSLSSLLYRFLRGPLPILASSSSAPPFLVTRAPILFALVRPLLLSMRNC